MIQIPNNLKELQELRKANNGIIKINSTGKMNGLYPAIKQVAEWIGSEDKWEVYFIAAKQYHVLLDMQMNVTISLDWQMGKMKSEYKDSFGRIVKIFKDKEAALNYLQAA